MLTNSFAFSNVCNIASMSDVRPGVWNIGGENYEMITTNKSSVTHTDMYTLWMTPFNLTANWFLWLIVVCVYNGQLCGNVMLPSLCLCVTVHNVSNIARASNVKHSQSVTRAPSSFTWVYIMIVFVFMINLCQRSPIHISTAYVEHTFIGNPHFRV
jgi:hypothetical protein